ncbi:CHAT domain-containing tetratricopeptide repeat protein [Kutzneria kofuensis]|uniref:Tetratricopeptide (TPR) repeat protein n=1 Tax=Kutzneria kofuensis TaxID=103725 RepID=A0A7W9KFQ8_9PSEU|nr:CHAT domain-containing tetratricopeptide repeat protein [Kutzneria kofuensis]MBB5891797.1 tetratricopeptide (TPR) repeat protein [Kutzneria kofuensis]
MNSGTALAVAEEALRLADKAAGRAGPTCAAAVRRARHDGDADALSIAERAWGRSLLQCGDVAAAAVHLRRSIAAAERPELAGESRIPLAAALLQQGRPGPALREIDLAVRDLDGAGRARARAQRADMLHQLGRLSEAHAEYQAAVPLLRRTGDLLNLQRTLVNRGILHTERHSFGAAEADLTAADQLAHKLGRQLAAGIIAENLGFLETLRGDVPAALAHLDRAEQAIGAEGGQLGPVFMDRGELLLAVGSASEAQEAAERAVHAFERERRGLLLPGARVLLAQAALLARDWPTALTQAQRARRQFLRQQRGEWAELARLIVVRSSMALGRPVSRRGLRDMVTALVRSGWPAAALEARLAAALVLGDGELLGEAASARRRGPAGLRARGWYAEALLRERAGDARGSSRALRRGLRVLDEHSMSLGATDLRAYSAVHRVELTELGLRTALRDGRVPQVFEWAERSRRLLHQPVLPPDDPVLADLLAQLRSVVRNARHAQRQVGLERRIRDHVRLHRGGDFHVVEPISLRELDLGASALIEYVQLDGQLLGIGVVDGVSRLVPLGSVADVFGLVERLPFALHRLARRSSSGAQSLLTDAASRLDKLLLEPFHVDDRPLVVVPTGPLHDLPWSVLPGRVGRPVTVSPSATLWQSTRFDNRPGVAVVAGPGLSGARDEALAVAKLYGVDPWLDSAATVDRVLGLLRSCGVAHLAAHGRLALDNPLFSSLRLHDGPLVVHDLERTRQVPHTVVLASCDIGRSLVCTGDELLGLSATFLSRGTATLIASVVPIPDLETAPLMTAFHRGLLAGLPAPAALAAAQSSLAGGSPRDLAAAAGFVCLGGKSV